MKIKKIKRLKIVSWPWTVLIRTKKMLIVNDDSPLPVFTPDSIILLYWSLKLLLHGALVTNLWLTTPRISNNIWLKMSKYKNKVFRRMIVLNVHTICCGYTFSLAPPSGQYFQMYRKISNTKEQIDVEIIEHIFAT